MFSRNDLVRDSYPRPLEPTLGSLCFPRRHGRRGLRRLDHDHNADNRRARRRGAVVEYRVGGTPVTATLTLTAVAPAGGAAVTLASSNAAVVVPASVTIPEGTNALSFSVATTSAAASTIITATYAGASQTATLTTTVVTVSALQGLFLSNSVSIAGVRSERRAPRPAGGSRSAAAILRSSAPATVLVPPSSVRFQLSLATGTVSSVTAVTSASATRTAGSRSGQSAFP
jgi:hypothetical protein